MTSWHVLTIKSPNECVSTSLVYVFKKKKKKVTSSLLKILDEKKCHNEILKL